MPCAASSYMRAMELSPAMMRSLPNDIHSAEIMQTSNVLLGSAFPSTRPPLFQQATGMSKKEVEGQLFMLQLMTTAVVQRQSVCPADPICTKDDGQLCVCVCAVSYTHLTLPTRR